MKTMKELKKSIAKEFPPLKLYLDDVHKIYNIFEKSCSEKITVTTEDFEVQDITRFKDLGPKDIHTLKFNGGQPYISLDLGPNQARLWISEDSTLNRGIASEIEEVLGRCYRRIARVFTNLLSLNLIGALIFVPPAVLTLQYMTGSLRWGLLILLIVLYGSLFFLSFRLSFKWYSTITFSERCEEKNFFARNKDGILIALISATVTAIITVIAMIF